MYKFEEIFSIEHLLKAHYKARKNKRHKNEVVVFELHLTKNILSLYNALLSNSYKIRGYKKFMIYDPKEREIQALTYYDRIVQNCLCYNFLVPYYSKYFIYDNCACQKGKGTHFARKRLENNLREIFKQYKYNSYVLKIDIKKYFNNIDHSVLKEKLGVIYDNKLKELINQVIDSYNKDLNCGVPMGNQSSQVFALLYLNEIDRLIKEKYHIKYYVRYMDDLIILHNDKNILKSLFNEIKDVCNKLKLELNHKSEIYPLKNGVDCLGVRYYLLSNGKLIKHMRPQNKKRMLNKIKNLQIVYRKGLINNNQIEMSIAGFYGNVKRLMVSGVLNRCMLNLKHLVDYY